MNVIVIVPVPGKRLLHLQVRADKLDLLRRRRNRLVLMRRLIIPRQTADGDVLRARHAPAAPPLWDLTAQWKVLCVVFATFARAIYNQVGHGELAST